MAFYSNILYIFAEISISLGKRFRCQYLYYACGISINPPNSVLSPYFLIHTYNT